VEVKKTGAFRASLSLIILPRLIRGDKEFAAQTYAPICFSVPGQQVIFFRCTFLSMEVSEILL
jgi:hypothetical protein